MTATDMTRNVALLAICQAILMTGSSLLIATSALVGVALADNPAWGTLPLALQFAAMTATTVPASLLMQRLGRRPVFLAGLGFALLGVGLAVTSILQGLFGLFALASVLLGIFNGIGQFFRFAAADVAGEGNKGRAISWVLAGGIVAGFMGPNLGSWTSGWFEAAFAGSYLVLGAFYLLAIAVVAALRIPRPPRPQAGDGGRSMARIARQPGFVVAVLTAAVGYGVMNIIMVATPLAMAGHAHPFSETAFVIQWHVVAMFLPSFFTGELIRRLGVVSVIQAGVAMMLGCVAINLTGNGVWHYWAALVCLGVGWNFMFIGGTTLLTRVHDEVEKGRTQALNDFLVFGIVSLTALSASGLLEAVGWAVLNLSVLPFLLMAALAVLAYAGWWAPRQRTTQASTPG